MQDILWTGECSITWHKFKYTPHNLYPTSSWELKNDHPNFCPTSTKIQLAGDKLKIYWFLFSGINIIRDPLDKNPIIPIFEFIPYEELTSSELENLNYFSTFIQQYKCGINSVYSDSRVWAHLILAIGWKKLYWGLDHWALHQSFWWRRNEGLWWTLSKIF